jgi:hypothetical protein
MDALLIRFTASPAPAMYEGAQGSVERMERLGSFYADIKQKVRSNVAAYDVEVTDLESMGAMIIYGEPPTLEELRRPGGPLDFEGIVVEDDATFLAHSF